jgi:hypothetical protein
VTTPKVSTIKRGGSRFYVNPETGEKVPGVTSVLGMLPKDFLKYWAAKSVAQTAVNNIGEVVGIAMRDPDAAVDFLKRSPDRDTYKAADAGTGVHELYESLARGEEVDRRRLTPELRVYAESFDQFVAEFQPEFLHLEETVWSETHGYAGSFDAIARIDGEIVILDWKTTRSGVHEEVALQMTAYKNADYILTADGEKVPLPEIEAAAVLHTRPEGWNLYPVSIDDSLFETFLALLNSVFPWERGGKNGVIGRPINASAQNKGRARR